MKPIQAWHFVADNLRDGSPIPRDGAKLKYDGPLKLCQTGLHASLEPYDALQYAPRDTLCLVRCGGEIIHGNDKLVCSERTIVARMDASKMLRYFARMQALSVIHLYPNDTDDVVFDWLMTGDDTLLSAALSAAWAAYSTADSAARSAALSAAWAADSAADSAALSAALSAADSAAGSAARSAAWAAARSAAEAAAYSAADSAAWAAAEAAADSAARAEFNSLVRECFEDFLS